MNSVANDLSTEERETACQLWSELVLSSPNSDETKGAQHQLVEAPPAIQQALINAIVKGLRTQQELHALPNPFASKK